MPRDDISRRRRNRATKPSDPAARQKRRAAEYKSKKGAAQLNRENRTNIAAARSKAARLEGFQVRRSVRAAALEASRISPDLLQYFQKPIWGPFDKYGGGSRMEVVLGPEAGQSTKYGSVPSPGQCKVVEDLNAEEVLAAHNWIKGHLLNDNLGGPGSTENLTPLTNQGNKIHSGSVEEPLKRFIGSCYSRTLYNKGDEYLYGAYYKVVVSDERWEEGNPLLGHAPKTLIVSCWPVRFKKPAGPWEAMSDSDYPQDWTGERLGRLMNFLVENAGWRHIVEDIEMADA